MTSRGPNIAPRTALGVSPSGPASGSSPDSSSPGAITSIVTSREWVLPPRPKPGRKPSSDMPVSKRKAQNRAAQRAFRERRATRVQELEQQLLEVEKEKELKEMGLVNTINKLKFENLILSKSVEQLRLDFNTFRSSMGTPVASGPAGLHISHSNRESFQQSSSSSYSYSDDTRSNAYKSELSQSAQHLLNFAKSLPGNHATASPALLLYSVQQILPAPSADSPRISVLETLALHAKSRASLSNDIGPLQTQSITNDFDCGVCTKEQCLCEDVGLKAPKSLEETFKTFAPVPAVALHGKRKLNSSGEVDFTAQFTQRKMPDLKRLRKNSAAKKSADTNTFDENSPVENCGFCSDDTPCVCREAAEEAARMKELSLQQEKNREDVGYTTADEAGPTLLPPIQVKHPSMMRKASLPVMHPGPTFELREITNMSLTTLPKSSSQDLPFSLLVPQDAEDNSGCTGNPGTCSQCQSDPMSTLFCSTVASKAAQQKSFHTNPEAPTDGRASDYVSSPYNSLSDSQTASGPGSTNPSTPIASAPSGPSNGLSNGIFIPCADAYRTLSRHKRFNSIDFLSLVGRLTTRGMQVEVQSVANMIRELDKKVYD